MKRLIPFVLLALFGAGCLSSRTKPAPLTTISVPEAKTAATATQNQVAPDSDQWKEYDNRFYGFGFSYPDSAFRKTRLDNATGTILTLDFGSTVASTTAVASPNLSLKVMILPKDGRDLQPGAELKDGCYGEMGGPVSTSTRPRVDIGGRQVCLVDGEDVGAGNFYRSYWYTAPLDDAYMVLAFSIHATNGCGMFDKPGACITFDEERDSQVVEAMAKTLRFFAPAGKAGSAILFEERSQVKGGERYEVTFKYPYMIKGPDALRRSVNSSIRAYMDTTTAAFMGSVKDNQDYPGSGAFQLIMEYDVPYFSPDIVNMVLDGYQYTGGAHGMQIYRTMVFDAANGKEMKLNDFFKPDSGYLKSISDFAAHEITKRDVSDADWIKSGTAPEAGNYPYFFWTQEGLNILFPPYQVAPYAAGPQYVVVPYGELEDVLTPRAKKMLSL